MTTEPDPLFPHPKVELVVVIDLDRGRYEHGEDVLERLREQARHIPGGAAVTVRLGRQALYARPIALEREIASHLYLAAARIDIEVPGGVPGVAAIQTNVQRHVRAFRRDHAQQLSAQRHPG